MSEAARYQRADATQQRDPRLAIDLSIVENATGDLRDSWYVAGAVARSEHGAWWVGEPMQQMVGLTPALAWEHWSEREGNGYNNAVFHYWVESLEVAEELVERRRLELEDGANPYGGEPLERDPSPVDPGDDESDPHAWCRERELTHSLSQAMVWRLASELVRRHPTRLWVDVEGGGMYDRVNIVDISGPTPAVVAAFDVAGTDTSTPAGAGLLWTRAHRDDGDAAEWVREFERRCALPPTEGRLPPSTPPSLAVRWVSAFLTTQIGSRRAWFTQPAHHFDRDRTAKVFPGAGDWQRREPVPEGTLVYLGQLDAATPQLIVSRDGDVWRDDGQHHRLPELHRPGDPITSLLLRTVPDLLP